MNQNTQNLIRVNILLTDLCLPVEKKVFKYIPLQSLACSRNWLEGCNGFQFSNRLRDRQEVFLK